MSCACEYKKAMSELDRVRRLAKAASRLEGRTMMIYCNADGSYNFGTETNKPIVEYVTPF